MARTPPPENTEQPDPAASEIAAGERELANARERLRLTKAELPLRRRMAELERDKQALLRQQEEEVAA